MATYLLIARIEPAEAAKILSSTFNLLGKEATLLCDSGKEGKAYAIGFVSDKDATTLCNKISDFIHGNHSFVLMETGKDWAACNTNAARSAWLRKNVNSQEFVGESRVIQRG